MPRRTLQHAALGVLAALAAAALAATVEPASASPTVGTVGSTIAGQDARPAFTPIGTQYTVKDHGLLVCPPPANYDPSAQ